MKKVIYLLGIMLLMVGAAKAQDTKAEIGPEIKFEKVVHDYGDVPYNGNGECEFRFSNTGDAPPADSETKVKLRLHYPFMAPRAHPPR